MLDHANRYLRRFCASIHPEWSILYLPTNFTNNVLLAHAKAVATTPQLLATTSKASTSMSQDRREVDLTSQSVDRRVSSYSLCSRLQPRRSACSSGLNSGEHGSRQGQGQAEIFADLRTHRNDSLVFQNSQVRLSNRCERRHSPRTVSPFLAKACRDSVAVRHFELRSDRAVLKQEIWEVSSNYQGYVRCTSDR